MKDLFEGLQAIKEKKEQQLKKYGEDSLGYTVLNEEIEDVKYAIKTLTIDNDLEREGKLNNVLKSTTSGSIYDALSKWE